jgi:hypothetical protein
MDFHPVQILQLPSELFHAIKPPTRVACYRSPRGCVHILSLLAKGRGQPITCHWRHRGGEVVQHYSCLTSTLSRWVGNVTPRPLYLQERVPVHMVQEAGWISEVRRRENLLPPTGVGTPNRSTPSESLYRQHCPGPLSILLRY